QPADPARLRETVSAYRAVAVPDPPERNAAEDDRTDAQGQAGNSVTADARERGDAEHERSDRHAFGGPLLGIAVPIRREPGRRVWRRGRGRIELLRDGARLVWAEQPRDHRDDETEEDDEKKAADGQVDVGDDQARQRKTATGFTGPADLGAGHVARDDRDDDQRDAADSNEVAERGGEGGDEAHQGEGVGLAGPHDRTRRWHSRRSHGHR